MKYPVHIPMGVQGFKNPEDAKHSASQYLIGLPFCIMRNGNDYGWCAPVSYAKKIEKENGVDILGIYE